MPRQVVVFAPTGLCRNKPVFIHHVQYLHNRMTLSHLHTISFEAACTHRSQSCHALSAAALKGHRPELPKLPVGCSALHAAATRHQYAPSRPCILQTGIPQLDWNDWLALLGTKAHQNGNTIINVPWLAMMLTIFTLNESWVLF